MSFISSSTPHEFLEALENTDKTEGLIIDIRGNTGGLLPNAVFVTNLFIPRGKIVSIVGRNGFQKDIMAQDNNVNIEKPVIILVDGASASASEIFSGAMKDYRRAKLIGTKTYGKGMVQKIIPMPNETGLNLTIAKYLTPKGKDINKLGIDPDIVLPQTVENIVDTIADIIDPDVRRGYEDSPEGALATYANNMAFIPPYHSMQQQVLPPQQTIPQSQQINPSIQQQMVLLNKPDIVDANYALKYDLRDITEIDNLTIRINKVFANPEILEFINKFKFINKFYVAEYKKSEFTLMAPTSTSYVYIKALSDGDYKVAEIPFKPN